MEAFIDFVKDLFPIKPYVHEKVKDCLSQFKKNGNSLNYTAFSFTNDGLIQGDIIESLPFAFFANNGEERILKVKAMLISNSCDMENDENVIFAPMIPINSITKGGIDRQTVVDNKINSIFYVPADANIAEDVVDLSLMCSFPRKAIADLLSAKRINKVIELNNIGYYLFLCKLVVHFMRPESKDVTRVSVE